MKELTTLLVKHYGLTEGRYDILIEFQIGVGAVGPSKESKVPGAIVGVSRIGISAATEDGAGVVDAADVTRAASAKRSSPTSAKPKRGTA
jgi:hypothetical protein